MNDERSASDDPRQAMLTMALEEHFGRGPADVAAAVMAARPPLAAAPTRGHARGHIAAAPATAARRAPSRLAAAAVIVLGIGTVVGVALQTPRSHDVPAQGAGEALLPLAPGAKWTFAVTRDGLTREVVRRVLGSIELPVDGGAPQTVHQVLVEDGNATGFEYWSLDARGLWRQAGTRGFGATDGVRDLTQVVALPLGSAPAWETGTVEWRATDVVAAPGGGGAGGKSQRVAITQRVELVDKAAEVRVAAGTFRAVHVRIGTTSPPRPEDPKAPPTAGDPTPVEHVWLAPGVGVVRATFERDGKEVEVAELRAFAPGIAEPSPRQALQTFLTKDAGVTNHGPVQSIAWVEPSPREVLLCGRFAVVSFVDRKITYRVRRGAVAEFDGSSADSWSAVIGDEGMTAWRAALLPQLRCTTLADLALRLHALREGLQFLDGDSRTMGVRIDPAAASCTRTLKARAPDGAERRLQAELTVGHGDEVRSVELRD